MDFEYSSLKIRQDYQALTEIAEKKEFLNKVLTVYDKKKLKKLRLEK